jgi:hypothetical protein
VLGASPSPVFSVEASVTDGRVAAIYALALVPAGGLAVAASAWVMDLSKQPLGQPSGLDGWALNIVPALTAGLLVYLGLARVVGARTRIGRSLGGHVRRTAVLYVVALGLGAILLHDAPSPDFWSLGQLVLWPWLAAVAGIVADLTSSAH